MKKIVLIFAIMLLTFSVAHAQWVINEGFEGTFPPTGWLSESASGDLWVQDDGTTYGPGSAYSGTYAAMYNNYDYSSGNSGAMTTPAFDISALTSPQLDFYWWNDDSSYNPAKLILYTSDDGAVFTPFDTLDVCQSGGWVNYNTPLATTVTHVKFEAISDYGLKNTFVDNFKIGQPIPYDLVLDQLTPDATIIEGQSFNYFIKVANVGLNNDTYDLTATGGTWTYEIRDKNDAGVISSIAINSSEADTVILKVIAPVSKDISEVETFTATSQGDPTLFKSIDVTTTVYVPLANFFEDFETCVQPYFPDKWSKIVQSSSSSAYVRTNSSATYAHSGLMSGKMYNYNDLSAELLIITPALASGPGGNKLSFWSRSGSTQNFIVGTITDPTDPSTFTPIETFGVTTTYTEFEYVVNFAKGTGYVAWKHANDGSYDSDYIDDVSWVEILPHNVAIDQLTPDAEIIEGVPFNYFLEIQNIGTNNDTYDLTETGGTWTYDIRDKNDTGTISSIAINANEVDTVIVKVTSPVAKDISDTVTFTATSQGDPTIFAANVIASSAYAPYITFFEDFETCVEPDLPDKWSNIVQSTTTYAYVKTWESATYSHSGIMNARMYNGNDLLADLLLITPGLESAPTGNFLKFWGRCSSGTQYLIVGTMTDPSDPSTFTEVASCAVTNVYSEHTVAITTMRSTGYVAIKHGLDGTYDYFNIDDVSWEVIPAVPVIALSDTTHDFGWLTEGEPVDSWDVTIFNNGGGMLYINDVTVDAPFSCVYPDSVLPSGSEIATISLDTSALGVYADVLEFQTNAPEPAMIDLSVIIEGTDYVMEGFEETMFPPFGWDNPGDYWARFMTDAYEGQGYARVSWYHDVDAILMSPRLVISGGDFIDFFWRNDNLYEAKGTEVITGDTLWVEISNTYLNTTPEWEVIGMFTSDAPMDDYEEAIVLIPDTYIGNDAKVRWRHRSEVNSESRGVGLDNVVMPAPYLPINFSVDPYYASDYVAAGNSIQYTYDVTNMGVQSDRFIILVQDSSAIRYNKRDVEDFETTDGGWVATADWDPVGDWEWTNTYDVANYTGANSPPPAAHSGTGLWATKVNGDYTNSGGSSYMSQTFDFSSVTDAYLNFWYWSDIFGDWDYCDVIVNSDILLTIDSYPGTVWEYADLDLSAYDGVANVQVVFSFYATTVVEYAGMYIDDLDIPGGGGPGPVQPGWPATVNVPYLYLVPGETGSFVLTISIPEEANEDDVQLTPVLVYSREDYAVEHQVLALALCHPKDPYEPNDLIVDATAWAYGEITEEAQIYYNADYRDKDIDIYEFSGLEGDIILCDFILPPDELLFDGAIKLVDVDSTEIAYADEWAGGGSEQLQFRLLSDGTYYLVLGKWDNVLDGPYKKDQGRGVNTCYYAMSLELIPSPDIAVSPDSLQLGIIYNRETASVDMFIENTGVTGCEDLTFNIDVVIPGVETLYESGFEDGDDWTEIGGTNWGINNSSYAGGTPPEARFYWSPNVTALQRIISPVINTTGYTSANLTFKHYVNDYAGGYTIGVATTSDGGTTWNSVWSTIPAGSIGPETYEITVDNADMGSDQFQLCWYFDGISYDINYWYVDDVNFGVGTTWCTVEPFTGIIGQGAIQTCVVTCDETGLTEPGIYTADIIVHNDALLYGVSDVTIPLTFFYQVAAQGLQGTVTFEATGEPIENVKVSAGNFVTYTDSLGFYQFTDIASGIYDVKFEKDGFATLTRPGIYVSPNWVTLLDVSMMFDGPPPRNLNATGANEQVVINWLKPENGGGGGDEFTEGFESGDIPAGWLAVDNDGDGYNWEVWSAFVHTGTYSAASFSYINAPGPGAVTPDNYLITPQVELGSSSQLTFWVGASDAAWYSEHFKVKLSTTGSDPTDFTIELMDYTLLSAAWTQLTIDLSAYADQQVYLAWVHCDVTDQFNLSLDDIELTNAKQLIFAADFESNDDIDNFKRVSVPSNSIPFRLDESMGELEIKTRMNDYLSPKDPSPSDFTLLGYNVYEEGKGFVAYVDGENTLTYTDDIVAVGTEYTYYARGLYDEGEGAESNHDSAIPIILEFEDFEDDNGGFVGTGLWQWGAPTSGPGNAHSGDNVWATNLSGNYENSASYTLDTPEIQVLDSEFMFWHWYSTENSWDGGNVKISTDDGATWTVIIPDGGYPDDAIVGLGNEPGYTANSGDWTLAVFDVSAYLGLTVKYRWHFGSDSSVNSYPGWYIDDVLIGFGPPPDYGALEGTVTDGDLVPLEGVAVDADFLDYNTVYTNADGYYSIDPMRVGLYDVTFSKVGYCTITVEDVEIEDGITDTLDVILGHPTMDITPTSIPDATVPVGGTTTRTITVTNNGNAPLDWDASLENLTDTNYSINYDLQTNPPTPGNSEMAPFSSGTYEGDISEDTWDILYNFNAAAAGQPGIETNDLHIFTCDWRADYTGFYKYDMDGTFVESFDIAGATCIRDMAYDGTYFYGSPASTTIYKMDLENQTLIGTISVSCAGVTGVRHIAFDPELDGGNGGFWIGNWDELGAIDKDGNQIYANVSPAVQSLYGSAYDPFTADGPYLWLFSQEGSGVKLAQFEIATQSFTGVTHDATDIPGFNAGIAGGAATYITPEGIFALLVNIQQDPNLIAAYELCEATPPWITIDPDAGTVAPYGAFEEVTVYFDAGDDPIGTIHTCDITFASAQGVPSVTVPVTLMVGTPEYGDLTGTVTAATGGAPIEGAEITASNDADYTYVTYTNSLGVYTIEDMMVGYYTVECTAVGYNYQVVPDVEIIVDYVTTQNFALLAPIMVVDPTSLNVNVPPGSTSTSYITIYNNGDGPMDFDVNLYDYGKVLTDYSNCTIGGTVGSQNGLPTGPGNSDGFQADGTRDVILHYDGPNFDAIGLTSGGTFMVAARFTSDELGIYYDTYEITGVEIYINHTGSALTLKIWEGGSFGDPGSEVYSQDVFGSIVAESWNILDLTTNVPLLAGNEYWVGYETTHIVGEYPAGCDAGPAVDGKGDWIYLAPGPWDQLHIIAPSLNYNWNIRMVIDFGTAPWITVDPLFGTIPAGGSRDLAVIFDATDLTQGEVKTADIEIVPTPDVGTVTVPVTLTVSEYSNGEELVKETKLHANFPNPMFNTTTFSFSLKERSHVTLSIYNVKGQLVGILLNDELDSSASHTVEWDGTANGKKLANGIYFYKLETNTKSFLNKMILMK